MGKKLFESTAVKVRIPKDVYEALLRRCAARGIPLEPRPGRTYGVSELLRREAYDLAGVPYVDPLEATIEARKGKKNPYHLKYKKES